MKYSFKKFDNSWSTRELWKLPLFRKSIEYVATYRDLCNILLLNEDSSHIQMVRAMRTHIDSNTTYFMLMVFKYKERFCQMWFDVTSCNELIASESNEMIKKIYNQAFAEFLKHNSCLNHLFGGGYMQHAAIISF